MSAETWHILRVLAGRPLKVADTIEKRIGIEAYCPREVVERRSRHGHGQRGEVIRQQKALLPGYVFTRSPFDTARLKAEVLLANRERLDPNIPNPPRTVALTVRWLTFDGRYLTVTDRAIEVLRREEARKNGQPLPFEPEVEAIVNALKEVAKGIWPNEFTSLGALQILARGGSCAISAAGRAA